MDNFPAAYHRGGFVFSGTPSGGFFYMEPFHDPANVPLYLLALGMVGIGIFLGVIATWLSMGRLRKDRRTLRKTVKMLEKELGKANAEIFNGSLIEGPKDD